MEIGGLGCGKNSTRRGASEAIAVSVRLSRDESIPISQTIARAQDFAGNESFASDENTATCQDALAGWQLA